MELGYHYILIEVKKILGHWSFYEYSSMMISLIHHPSVLLRAQQVGLRVAVYSPICSEFSRKRNHTTYNLMAWCITTFSQLFINYYFSRKHFQRSVFSNCLPCSSENLLYRCVCLVTVLISLLDTQNDIFYTSLNFLCLQKHHHLTENICDLYKPFEIHQHCVYNLV